VLKPNEIGPETVAQLLQSSPEQETGTPRTIAAIVESRLYVARNDSDLVVISLHTPPDWPRVPVSFTERPPFTLFRTGATGFVSRRVTVGSMPQEQLSTEAIPAETTLTYSVSAVTPGVDAPATNIGPLPSVIRAENPALNISAEWGALRLHISAHAGQTIRVQRSGDLTGPWTDWATAKLRGDEIDFTDLPGETRGFYRVVAE
jgi:hypothetical protein